LVLECRGKALERCCTHEVVVGSIVGRSTTLDIFHCKSLRHLVEVSSLTEDCRHGVPLVRRKEDLEQRGGEDIDIDDALTGKSLDQNLHRKDLVLPGRSLQV
jgi:hypothetical protein